MRALITANFDKEALNELGKYLEVEYRAWNITKHVLSQTELLEHLNSSRSDILIVELEHVDQEVIDNAKDLKLIGVCRNDPRRNVDIEAATARGIPVIYTPGRNTNAVAELVVAAIILLLRKITSINLSLKSGSIRIESFKDFVKYYEEWRGGELCGKTVGIIGLGRIGYRVAELIRAFGAQVLVYDPYVPEEKVKNVGGTKVDLKTLLLNSDIVTLHVPPLETTVNMIGRRELELMKPGALLVNFSNPTVVDEDALYEALSQRRIAGAALDVFYEEPVDSSNRFLKLDNVLVTPHVGGNTSETVKRQSFMILDDVLRFLRGEKPARLANPEVWERCLRML
ncbi:MAG: NAD(P)-binding domain-containing protein [Thermofilaceae archaeon]|nr:NAD(P)-binding domain-containing protein [Thermofilaceae archaeon]MCX8180279.1 NAD(P)-binding domain-containing protein [Thermofilaceae archaeon]MDW8004001.1 NAD(P)-dependent oxidoreductase [Thermofilaceae archaeon]